jgi:hypothetical protein
MHSQGRVLVGGVILLIGLSVLACSLGGQAPATATATAAPTDSPAPSPSPVPATATLPPPTATATATLQPPTATAATATPATPATAAPTGAPLLVVEAPDKTVGLVTLDGQARPLAQAPATIYVGALLSNDPAPQVYAIGPQGAQPLSFVGASPFAVYTGPAAPQGLVAWISFTTSVTSQITIQEIHVAALDGSNARVVLEKPATDFGLAMMRWSPDGKRLYYGEEPMGLGGQSYFTGFSDLWSLDLASGKSAQIVAYTTAYTICLDDFTADAGLVGDHCWYHVPPFVAVIDLLSPSSGAVTPIQPPPGLPFQQLGDVRFSPDETRLAYGMALGNPDSEQGWVAVSDGLSGASHLVATSPQNDFYNVKGWLDNNTLILQSGRTPGVWLVQADGANLHRVADGTFLGVMTQSR